MGGTRAGGDAAAGPGLRAGDEFAGHRIESELGRGGMGVVYRARHLALDRTLALKLIASDLAADEQFRARFARESRLAASIEHPNVIPVHHAGEEAGRPYLSMRIVEGPDLGTLVASEGPLEPARAAEIVAQVAAGLDAAHERGLVHRDVKPSNILIEGSGAGEQAYVTDFGISRLASADPSVTGTGEFLGSPDYVAPEQIEGELIDRRADVYSLGGLAHFLLTGEAPFPNRSEPAKLVAHGKAPRPKPSALAAVPKAVDAVIAKAMAVDPDQRYASAGRFAAALGRATKASSARRAFTGVVPPVRRRPAIWIALGVLAVTALALIEGTRDDGGGGGPAENPAGHVVAEVPVSGDPVGVFSGDFKVWAASPGPGELTGIDPATGKADPPTGVGNGSEPVSVVVGFGSVWAVDRAGGRLVRLNPGEEDVPPLAIGVSSDPTDVAIGEGSLWVTSDLGNTVSRVDPIDNLVTAAREVPGAHAVAYGEGAVWVAGDGGVWPVDPATNTVGEPIELDGEATDIAVGEGYVWVVDNGAGELLRIDPAGETLTDDPIPVGSKPRGVAVGFGSVWIANGGDSTVIRIDARTREAIGGPIRVGAEPADVSVGFDSVWTADSGGSSVSRIEPG